MAFVLRAAGLGDLLVAVPALRAVRAVLADHQIVLGAPDWLAPIVGLIGGIDALHPVDGVDRLPGRLAWPHRLPVDVAVNLHGAGPHSHQLLAGVHPNRLVAFAAPGWPDGPPWSVPSGAHVEHQVHRWLRLVRTTLGPRGDHTALSSPAGAGPVSGARLPGADPGDDRDGADPLQLDVPEVPPPVAGAVIVHPGAAWGSRRWPLQRYVALIRALRRTGAPVVLTGGRQESGLVAAVADGAGLPDGHVLAGRTSLLELASLVAHARLLVSGDTGVAHLATAYGTPSVVLFGPVPPAEWGPPPCRSQHVAIWHGDRFGPDYRGDPFAEQPDPGLASITVGEVLAAARRVTSPPPAG